MLCPCPLRPVMRPTQIHFFLLFSRQGKVRLSKYYSTFSQKERAKARCCALLAQTPIRLCRPGLQAAPLLVRLAH